MCEQIRNRRRPATIVLAAGLMVAMSIGPVVAGSSGSHTVKVVNSSRFVVFIQAFDNNDEITSSSSQQGDVAPGQSANFKCNTNDSCQMEVTFEDTPDGNMIHDLGIVSQCVDVNYTVRLIQNRC